MVLSEKQKRFKYYLQCLDRKRKPFACPRCGVAVLPKHYEKHCFQTHGFDKLCSCVWCWGETSWIAREKNENSVHLLECFRKFMLSYKNAASFAGAKVYYAVQTPIILTELIPYERDLCPGRCFFDHDSSYIRDLPEALNLFSILPLEASPIPYLNENMCLAASCVQKYLDTRDNHNWFHLMVKAVAFPSFVRAMNEDRNGVVRLLPFSCWCDSGPYVEARHRQHRHMIAVAPKDYFLRKIWQKVNTDDRPCANYPCKGLRRIKTPIHLVNTLGYVSKRTSQCEFTHQSNNKKSLKENHFYIFTTLPVQFQIPLAILWVGGLATLMYQQLFRRVSVERLIKYPLYRKKERWHQKIGDFYGLPRGLVLSLDRRCVPTERETSHCVYLLGSQKLYFELAPEPLDAKTWLARQIEGGSRFYDNVATESWTPSKSDQEKLNLVLPREYKIRDLGVEVIRLNREKEEFVDENRRLNKIHELNEGEIQRMKIEIERLKGLID